MRTQHLTLPTTITDGELAELVDGRRYEITTHGGYSIRTEEGGPRSWVSLPELRRRVAAGDIPLDVREEEPRVLRVFVVAHASSYTSDGVVGDDSTFIATPMLQLRNGRDHFTIGAAEILSWAGPIK